MIGVRFLSVLKFASWVLSVLEKSSATFCQHRAGSEAPCHASVCRASLESLWGSCRTWGHSLGKVCLSSGCWRVFSACSWSIHFAWGLCHGEAGGQGRAWGPGIKWLSITPRMLAYLFPPLEPTLVVQTSSSVLFVQIQKRTPSLSLFNPKAQGRSYCF